MLLHSADLKAKPQWNGRRGTIVGSFDSKAGRYTVQVKRCTRAQLFV